MSQARPDRKGQASSDGAGRYGQLHWQCVALCLQTRERGLKVIERHRLKRFIALHRAGVRIPKPVQQAAMWMVVVCKVRRRLLQMPKPQLHR